MTNEEWRQYLAETGSVFELLFRTARRVNEHMLSEIRTVSGFNVRESHTQLFPHFSVEGVRITELAEKLGVTKQAIAKRVDELEAFGFVEKIPDPADGRAKLVRVFPEAWTEGMSFMMGVEKEFASEVGLEEMSNLRDVLDRILATVEEREA